MNHRLLAPLLLLLLAGCTCGSPEPEPPERVVEVREGPCGVEDLVLYADVRARAGDDVPLTPRERLYLGVVIGNPCRSPITFVCPKACLVHEFALFGPDGATRPGGPQCAAGPREWVIEPTGGETMTFDLGMHEAGDYTATVPFTFTDRTAVARFTVLE